jgi:hypothetical protein
LFSEKISKTLTPHLEKSDPEFTKRFLNSFVALYYLDFNDSASQYLKSMDSYLNDNTIAETERRDIHYSFQSQKNDKIPSIYEFYHELLKGTLQSVGYRFSNLTKLNKKTNLKEDHGLEKYLSYWEFLRNQKPPLSLELIENIHHHYAGTEIELDQIRGGREIGKCNERDSSISKSEYNEILNNPYLNFEIEHQENEHIFGNIIYPHISNLKPEIEQRLSENEVLFKKYKDYKIKNNIIDSEFENQLNQEVIKFLINERIKSFLEIQGDIDPIEKIATLSRDLVSIHPFSDGNGRSINLLMNFLLLEAGFSPAIIIDKNLDILLNQRDWSQMVKDSIENTENLIADLNFRLNHHLQYKNSPYFLLPSLFRKLKVPLVLKKPVNVTELDPIQWQTFILTKISSSRRDYNDFIKNRYSYLKKQFSEFENFYQKFHINLNNNDNSSKDVGLFLITPDFIESYLKESRSMNDWKNKITLFYDSSKIVWRGLVSKNSIASDEKIHSMFFEPSLHTVSNRVAMSGKNSRTDQFSKNEAIEEFKKDVTRYNNEMISGDVISTLYFHQLGGHNDRYLESYGISTSRSPQIGRYFTKFQEGNTSIKIGGLNIGMYPPKTAASLKELSSLKIGIEEKFKEEECILIGGIDPESIQFIEVVGVDKEVIKTYYRDPEDYTKILNY